MGQFPQGLKGSPFSLLCVWVSLKRTVTFTFAVCVWYHIQFNQSSFNVASPTTAVNKLVGTIPKEFGRLSRLTELRLSTCTCFLLFLLVICLLHWSLMQLPHQRYVDVFVATDTNSLTGTIPTEFGNLSLLNSLDMCKFETHLIVLLFQYLFDTIFNSTNDLLMLHLSQQL